MSEPLAHHFECPAKMVIDRNKYKDMKEAKQLRTVTEARAIVDLSAGRVGSDVVEWQRLSDYPLLPNGQEGRWNSSESGHPVIFTDDDSRMYLFFQGNNNKARTWYLSKMFVKWQGNRPYLVCPKDKEEFHVILSGDKCISGVEIHPQAL